MSTDWKSTKTVELKISIDSINTFRNDVTWSAKTSIQREHEDRFYKQDNSNVLIRRIDPETEQINSQKYLVSSSKITQTNENYDWYLIYKTKNDLTTEDISNPINCFLCANAKLKVANASSISSKTYTYADFNDGVYYYFNDIDNNGGIVNGYTLGNSVTVVTDITYANVNVPTYTRSTRTLRGIVLYRSGTSLYYGYQFDNNIVYWDTTVSVEKVVHSTIGPAGFGTSAIPKISNLSGKPLQTITSITITKGKFFRYSSNYYAIPEQAYLGATQTMAAYIGQTAVYTNKFADVDKTDSRIVKIIKLPYAPCDITYSSGLYTFPST